VPGNRRCSYEFLGIDVLLDEDLKPWLLEINVTPGMAGGSELDLHVKRPVIYDMFSIIRMMDFTVGNVDPCREYVRIERVVKASMTPARVEAVVRGGARVWDAPVFADYMIVREFVDEQVRRRRYHRTYPKRRDMAQFETSFDVLEYEDLVLREFVKMGNAERFAALMNNFDVVHHGLQPREGAPKNGESCAVQ